MRLEARPGTPALHSALADAYYFKGMDKEAARELELLREAAGLHAVQVDKTVVSGGLQALHIRPYTFKKICLRHKSHSIIQQIRTAPNE